MWTSMVNLLFKVVELRLIMILPSKQIKSVRRFILHFETVFRLLRINLLSFYPSTKQDGCSSELYLFICLPLSVSLSSFFSLYHETFTTNLDETW